MNKRQRKKAEQKRWKWRKIGAAKRFRFSKSITCVYSTPSFLADELLK